MNYNVIKIGREHFPYNIQRMFFDRYAVRVPSISLKSISEVRARGVYAVDEDEVVNQGIHHNPVETSLTINQIFEIWRQGYEPAIIDASKTLEIFTIITDHLSAWVSYLNVGVQVSNPPFEDLLALDIFADKVYAHARFERSKRNINYFANAFGSDLGFNLDPTQQLRSYVYRPIGDGLSMVYDPDSLSKEDRNSYSEELMRLGGRHSPEMQQSERDKLFSKLRYKEGKKE